jgi:hypothetical protein
MSESDPAQPVASASPVPGAKPNSLVYATPLHIDATEREAMIRETAYLRAERRGFSPGQELEDWLAAEAQVDHLLTSGETAAK